MGWGAKLLGIAKIAGGAALTFGTGGAMAPVGVGLMASGGGDIVSDMAREEGKDTIEQATQQQTQSIDQAMALNSDLFNRQTGALGQLYGQQQANLGPYLALGAQGAQGTASMMGYGPLQMPAITVPTLGNGSGGTGTSTGAPATPNSAVPLETNSREGAVRRPQMQDPMTQATMQTQSAYAGGGTVGDLGARIKLQAPTGEVMEFAPSDPNVQKALSMGARRVA